MPSKSAKVHGVVVALTGASTLTPCHTWQGANGKRYQFIRDGLTRRHEIRFSSVEEYEAERENLIHSRLGQTVPGTGGLQVILVTDAFIEAEKQLAADNAARIQKRQRLAVERSQSKANAAAQVAVAAIAEKEGVKVDDIKLKSTQEFDKPAPAAKPEPAPKPKPAHAPKFTSSASKKAAKKASTPAK